MTMHASKGLEFAVVAVAGQMPRNGGEVADKAKLFYVAATRATQQPIVTAASDGAFAKALAA